MWRHFNATPVVRLIQLITLRAVYILIQIVFCSMWPMGYTVSGKQG